MKNLDLDKLGVQEMTQEEMLLVEGGSIFTKAWGGIKEGAKWVANAAEDTWEWLCKHVNLEDGKVVIR